MDVRSQISMVFIWINVSVVILVALPAKISGRTAKARNTCGGTMLRPSPVPDFPTNGRIRKSTKGLGEKEWLDKLAINGKGPRRLQYFSPSAPTQHERLLRAVDL